MAKTPIDKLDSAIKKILEEYADDINRNTGEIVKKMGQKGAQAIRNSAMGMFGGSGKYANGWTSKVQTGRLVTTATIHNKNAPGLAHLLEYGHAMDNGGRVQGRAHIAPVEEKIKKEFEEGVINAITGY